MLDIQHNLLEIDLAAEVNLFSVCFKYCLPTLVLRFVSSSHKLIWASSLPRLSESNTIVLSILSSDFWSCFKEDTTLLKYFSLLFFSKRFLIIRKNYFQHEKTSFFSPTLSSDFDPHLKVSSLTQNIKKNKETQKSIRSKFNTR